MPEIRTYTVTQIREVVVRANEMSDAVLIASAAFKYGQNSDWGVSGEAVRTLPDDIFGNTTKEIKELELTAKRVL